MKHFRLLMSVAAILIADVLFVTRLVVIDDVSGLFLYFVLIGIAIASPFLIYNYCFGIRRGENIYLLQIVFYLLYSTAFYFHDKIGLIIMFIITILYLGGLYAIYRVYRLRDKGDGGD